MNDTDSDFHSNVSSEGSEMNGKDSSYRNAPMISAPRVIQKRRVRGALVPMEQTE